MKHIGNGKDVIFTAFHWNVVKPPKSLENKKQRDSDKMTPQDYTGGTVPPCTWYKELLDKAKKGFFDKFSIIYLPPPWKESQFYTKNINGEITVNGGEGYFWHDFDLNSAYGSKNELVLLCDYLFKNGKKIIFDIVPNHRDNRFMEGDVWPYKNHPAWAKNSISGDTGGPFLGGECDLDTRNPIVKNRLIEALKELVDDCHASGWRWDLVWGFLPEEVSEWTNEAGGEQYFSLGEYWPSSDSMRLDPLVKKYSFNHKSRILGWLLDAKSTAQDYILKKHINTGCSENLKQDSLVTSAFRENIVTFVETHDTGSAPYTESGRWGKVSWQCPINFKHRAYAFILCMPGIPSIHCPDYFDFGFREQIDLLLSIRNKAGIIANSKYIFLDYSNKPSHNVRYEGCVVKLYDENDDEKLILAIDSNFIASADKWEKIVDFSKDNEGEYRIWITKGKQD